MPQPFPLKATDHCYGASGRLLMGPGCKLIGHRKAQNIQWCSAFITSWSGPCCRAKRWLISTLNSCFYSKESKGGRHGPLRQHPFDSNPHSIRLPSCSSNFKMPKIFIENACNTTHRGPGKQQQSEIHNQLLEVFAPLTWIYSLIENLNVQGAACQTKENYEVSTLANNCFSHTSFWTASVVLTRLNFSTEVTTIIYSAETQLEKWQKNRNFWKKALKADKTLAVCKHSTLAQCLSE